MKTFEIKKAERKQVKLKLNISSASGAGKTMGALLMAKGLVGDWNKIVVIDTENGSSSLYSHLGPFNTLDFQAPFGPERYIQAIDLCLQNNYECIIIDSASHEWSGAGGCIELNEQLAQSKFRGNTWSAWSDTTPRHDAYVNKILQSPIHIITCTRSKMETIMGDDKKVKKVGMKDIQRENWEYELTVSLSIDRDTHKAMASKDRTNLFEGKDPFIITEETGVLIKNWCNEGAPIDHIEIQAKSVESTPLINNYVHACNKLKKATSIQELKDFWSLIDKETQAHPSVEDQKNAMKLLLTKQPV